MSTYEGTYGRLPDCYGQRGRAVIVLDGSWNRGEPLTGRDVLLVSHPGNQGFGMYVLGHALFGKMLLEQHHRPSRLRSLVVVPREDDAMRLLARRHAILVSSPERPFRSY